MLNKFGKDRLFLIALIAFSFIIRANGLVGSDFSIFDEGGFARTSKAIYNDPSFIFSATKYGIGLYPLGAIFARVFGDTASSYRLVSVICGTISVLAFYLLTLKVADKNRAILSSIVFASYPIHIALSKTYYLYIYLLFCQ